MEDVFERVLAEAKAGAEWAITALYRDIQPSLLRYLRSQAPADAEDLASEVWLDVASGLDRFEGDETAFRRWLFTIARRRLIDLRRRDGRRRAVPDQAEVVLLRVIGGFTVDDVAAIVGKKPGAIRVLQHRGLKRLAEELARERARSVTR